MASIVNYGHPRHIPLVFDWVIDKNSSGDTNAPVHLTNITGISLDKNNVESWTRWWESNKSLLDRAYDLQSPTGRQAWMEAWNRADRDVRKILMKLWNYEAVPDQNSLVEEALSNEAARQILAKLWSEKRLSAETRKTIVKNHLTFHLERTPTAFDKPSKGSFNVAITAKSTFPFPARAIVNYGEEIALNNPPDPGRYRMSFSLADVTEIGYVSIIVFEADRARVNAVVQMREFEDSSNQKGLLWEAEWQLAPFITK